MRKRNPPRAKDFAAGLAELMEKTGVTPKTIAIETGVHISSVYYWLDGDRLPSVRSIWKMADALQVTPETLFGLITRDDVERTALKKE